MPAFSSLTSWVTQALGMGEEPLPLGEPDEPLVRSALGPPSDAFVLVDAAITEFSELEDFHPRVAAEMMAAPSEGRARGEGDWRLEMEIGVMGVEDDIQDDIQEAEEEVQGDITSCGEFEDVMLECYPNPKNVVVEGEEVKREEGKVATTHDAAQQTQPLQPVLMEEVATKQDAVQQTQPTQPIDVKDPSEATPNVKHDAAQQTQPAQPALKEEAAIKQDAVQQTQPTQPVDVKDPLEAAPNVKHDAAQQTQLTQPVYVKDLPAATSNQVSPTTTERLQPIPSSAARPSHASQPVSSHNHFLLSEEQRAKLLEHMEEKEKEKRAIAQTRKTDYVSIPRRNAGTLSELRVDETREEIALARAEAKRTNTPWPPIFNPSLHMAELRREEEKARTAAALVSSSGWPHFGPPDCNRAVEKNQVDQIKQNLWSQPFVKDTAMNEEDKAERARRILRRAGGVEMDPAKKDKLSQKLFGYGGVSQPAQKPPLAQPFIQTMDIKPVMNLPYGPQGGNRHITPLPTLAPVAIPQRTFSALPVVVGQPTYVPETSPYQLLRSAAKPWPAVPSWPAVCAAVSAFFANRDNTASGCSLSFVGTTKWVDDLLREVDGVQSAETMKDTKGNMGPLDSNASALEREVWWWKHRLAECKMRRERAAAIACVRVNRCPGISEEAKAKLEEESTVLRIVGEVVREEAEAWRARERLGEGVFQ